MQINLASRSSGPKYTKVWEKMEIELKRTIYHTHISRMLRQAAVACGHMVLPNYDIGACVKRRDREEERSPGQTCDTGSVSQQVCGGHAHPGRLVIFLPVA